MPLHARMSRPKKTAEADRSIPEQLKDKFGNVTGAPTIAYTDKMKDAIEHIKDKSAYKEATKKQRKRILRELIKAAMSHVGCTYDNFPKTFQSAVERAENTNAANITSFGDWSGLRDIGVNIRRMDKLTVDHHVDYMIYAPIMLVAFSLKMVRGMMSEGDSVSKGINEHKLWNKLPTAIVRWEQGKREKIFPMICPPIASRFTHGSTWEQWRAIARHVPDADEAMPRLGQARHHEADGTIGVDDEDILSDVPEQAAQQTMTNGVLINAVLDAAITPRRNLASWSSFLLNKRKTVTRQEVEEKLTFTFDNIDDRKADQEKIIQEVLNVVTDDTSRVIDPTKRWRLYQWMTGQSPDSKAIIGHLKRHLESEEIEITVSTDKTCSITAHDQFPLHDISQTMVALAAQAEPREFSQWLIEKSAQIHDVEVVYKETMRDLIVQKPTKHPLLTEVNTHNNIVRRVSQMLSLFDEVAKTDTVLAETGRRLLMGMVRAIGGISLRRTIINRRESHHLEDSHAVMAMKEDIAKEVGSTSTDTAGPLGRQAQADTAGPSYQQAEAESTDEQQLSELDDQDHESFMTD